MRKSAFAWSQCSTVKNEVAISGTTSSNPWMCCSFGVTSRRLSDAGVHLEEEPEQGRNPSLRHLERMDNRLMRSCGRLDARLAVAPPVGATGTHPQRHHEVQKEAPARLLHAQPSAQLPRTRDAVEPRQHALGP